MNGCCAAVAVVLCAAGSATAAPTSSAPAARSGAETASVANTPTTLAPRRASRTLESAVVANRKPATSVWYRSVPVALGVVLVLIVGGAALAKKCLPAARASGHRGVLEVVARTHLSPKQSVCLVRAGRQVVLVGVTPDRITRLAEFDDPEAVAQLIGRAESLKPNSSTMAFRHVVDDEVSAYEGHAEQDGNAEAGVDSGSYGQVRGQLQSLLSRVREYADNRRAG